MRKLLPMVIVAGLALFAYQRNQKLKPVPAGDPGRDLPAGSDTSQFRCDGRTHCSQMSSCAEATWFLEHCPGTKMDGDRDGIPCEDQHCGH